MVDSEYGLDNYKIFKKINIGAIIKNSKMIRFVPDHLKTKMCNHAVKKLMFLIKYVPCEYKTQQMGNKAVAENGGTLTFVSDNYKT